MALERADNSRLPEPQPSAPNAPVLLPAVLRRAPGISAFARAIVSRSVSGHRGDIRARDGRPRGTRFVVALPAGGA